jgi:hypothetical protein
MSRLSVAVVALVCSVAVVACADNILKERPSTKTVRSTGTRASFSAQGSAKGQSSVCAAYRRQLRVVQLRRATTQPEQAGQLKARELSLNAIIADACE